MDKNILQVSAVASSYLGFITLADIDLIVRIGVGVLTIGFIIYKWYRASQK